ncbi:ATPase P [Pseudodesulfovibrio sp.]|uniref:HAD family hydrolase n=1 Tax=Pseudodesulfovibrio sp. TaxID=2035812 RepID=UPI002611E5FB|nr:ATPase P [Pseudodesulfovibrio sp.]MDD3313377.1 ATPase P [Pseudodesulfovibrio sp.]
MRFEIPGQDPLELEHLVCDYNGTIAEDGRLIPGVADALNRLANSLTVHVVTADTHGSARRELEGVRCQLTIIGHEDQNHDKRDFVRRLGSSSVIALGNGRNDEDMLREAALGIVLVLAEGAFTRALMASDLVCTSALDALALFEKPGRLISGLRNR